jgi:uncharacterized membrane protein YbhN (UPF0104 family)
MIIEITTTKLLQVISLALTSTERWAAARHAFNASSAVEGWLTGFAMAALIISTILVFFLSANHRRSLDDFRKQIAGLTTQIIKLQQKIAGLSQYAPVEELEQEPSEVSEETVAIPEN